MNSKRYFVYIITNSNNSVLYIGVTSNLRKRIDQHKTKKKEGFSFKYNLDKLVFYESYGEISQAIAREKRLKKWNREWKNSLITRNNPRWLDLYDKFCGFE